MEGEVDDEDLESYIPQRTKRRLGGGGESHPYPVPLPETFNYPKNPSLT